MERAHDRLAARCTANDHVISMGDLASQRAHLLGSWILGGQLEEWLHLGATQHPWMPGQGTVDQRNIAELDLEPTPQQCCSRPQDTSAGRRTVQQPAFDTPFGERFGDPESPAWQRPRTTQLEQEQGRRLRQPHQRAHELTTIAPDPGPVAGRRCVVDRDPALLRGLHPVSLTARFAKLPA